MEFEFDKEMDALLRQTARGETAFAGNNRKSKIQNPKSLHLDADEISAFAENALPEEAKLRLTMHFADCDRCRKILSNTILLNSDVASETVHAPQTEKAAIVIPWYRRLFAAPTLASALGALVFIFAGLIALTFWQNRNDSLNSEITQSREVPINMQGASGEGETRTVESTVESGAAASNSSAMMSNYSSANSNSAMTNSATPNRPAGSTSNSATVSNSATATNKPAEAQTETVKNLSPLEDKTALAKKDRNENQASGASVAEQKKETARDDDEARVQQNDVTVTSPPPAPKPASPSPLTLSSRSAADSKSKTLRRTDANKNQAAESGTKRVGGKTFRRDGGVWYDSSYSGQSTTNVRRGTSDFRNLDSGLRSIADALSGTIVVVSNGKAYRIQ